MLIFSPCTANGYSPWFAHMQCDDWWWWLGVWSVNVIVRKSGVPIKDWVSTLVWHRPAEQSADIVIIRLGIERQRPRVAQQGSILYRKPVAQIFDRTLQLLLGYETGICQTLPRQAHVKEIYENVGKGLEVVSPSEFAACMTVIRCE